MPVAVTTCSCSGCLEQPWTPAFERAARARTCRLRRYRPASCGRRHRNVLKSLPASESPQACNRGFSSRRSRLRDFSSFFNQLLCTRGCALRGVSGGTHSAQDTVGRLRFAERVIPNGGARISSPPLSPPRKAACRPLFFLEQTASHLARLRACDSRLTLLLNCVLFVQICLFFHPLAKSFSNVREGLRNCS